MSRSMTTRATTVRARMDARARADGRATATTAAAMRRTRKNRIVKITTTATTTTAMTTRADGGARRASRRATLVGAGASDGAPSIAFDGEAVKKWAARATEAPWDAPAAGWREFFAARPIASVVEVDKTNETVSAKEVESHGLNWPTCKAEALERARVNTVRFRQNYAQIAAAATLLGCECAAFGLALVSLYLYLALKSDKILGELSLWTNGALKWNAAVVAGLPRDKLKTATLAFAVVLFLLSDATANTYAVIRSVMWSACIALVHAVLRPIDLKGTLANIVKDFRSAKNKEELKGAARAGFKSMKAWFSEKAKPVDSMPIVVVEKGANGVGSTNGNASPRDEPRRENADGAIDVQAREARETQTKSLPESQD